VLAGFGPATVPSGCVSGKPPSDGTTFTFRAEPLRPGTPVTPALLAQTAKRLCARAQKGTVVRVVGRDRLALTVPERLSPARVPRGAAATGRLFLYDWENNVLGAGCKPDPRNQNVTGGEAAGQRGAGSISRYAAVRLAATCKPTKTGRETTGTTYYLVDTESKKVLAGPGQSRRDLRDEVRLEHIHPTKTQETVAVPQGVTIVYATGPDNQTVADRLDASFALRDQPSLSGADITNPEQSFANAPGATGQPVVTFDFTRAGRKKWQATTRQIARRGRQNALRGQSEPASYQHFAIVLDNELITVPYINFHDNPDGLDGRDGAQISGGLTVTSAHNLVTILKFPLPVELVLLRVK
jgi:SecD/SecF fusion protein